MGLDAIAQFAQLNPCIEPVVKKEGKCGGTYAHPELAARFKVWCDPSHVTDLHVTNENQATVIKHQMHVIEVQAEVIEFQRTNIQSMLPFIPDSVIQDQIANRQTNRSINLIAGESDPGGHAELVAEWVDRHKNHPYAKSTARRMIESVGNQKPGHVYGTKYGFKSTQYKNAFKRWDDFECLVASLDPKYKLSVESVIEWLDRIDDYVI